MLHARAAPQFLWKGFLASLHENQGLSLHYLMVMVKHLLMQAEHRAATEIDAPQVASLMRQICKLLDGSHKSRMRID